jgi:hypothetical protein
MTSECRAHGRLPCFAIRRPSWGSLLLGLSLGLLMTSVVCAAENPGSTVPGDPPWALTLYGGVYTDNNLGEAFSFQLDLEDSYIAVLALSRKIADLTRHIRFEVEGQIGKHFGRQDHWEFNGLVVGRWLTFPWNDYVYTTFAVGEGISYATEVPKLEEELDGPSERLLNYLMFELTLSPPQHREWAFVTRIHHRSALFGAFGHGSSNIMAAGIKYRF